MKFLVLSLCLFSVLLRDADAAVTISGRNILVNGARFIGRGVAYSTTPIGQYPDSRQGQGTWDWISSPTVYNRDLPLLQELNVNLIRVYNLRPEVNHDAFLDACAARGIYVLLSFRWVWTTYDSGAAGLQSMRNQVVQLVQNHAKHPAVLGWCIGNELNLQRGTDAGVWTFVKELKDLVHTTEAALVPPTWHPVTSPLADGQSLFDVVTGQPNAVDFWAVQLYRGKTFYDFWTRYKAASTKPMIITEFGVDSYMAGQSQAVGQAQQGIWELAMWNEITANWDSCSGALLFQYVDVWYKCGSISAQDNCAAPAVGRFPGDESNEEYFGLMSIQNTQVTVDGNDTLAPKEAFCVFKHAWKNLPRSVSYTPTNISRCPSYPDIAKVYPTDDAFVKGGTDANNNFGTANALEIKYAPDATFVRESYIKFDLRSYASQGPFASAQLVLSVQSIDMAAAFPISVDVVGNGWGEGNLTFANKPSGTLLGVFTLPLGDVTLPISVAQVVNTAIQGSGIVSFRLYRPGGTGERLILNSKEAPSEVSFPRIELSATPIPVTTQAGSVPRTNTQPGSVPRSNPQPGTNTQGGNSEVPNESGASALLATLLPLVAALFL